MISGLPLKIAARTRLISYWLQAQVINGVLSSFKVMPADAALNFVGKAARKVGPLLGRHKIALTNLRVAYPDKSDGELETIASDMWENMARLAAEYVYLDQLFDFDPAKPTEGRIIAQGEELFTALRDDPRPKIFFTGHLGNFELLPICAATFGLEITAMFRPPNNPYIAKKVLAARSTEMGHLVPSKAGASITLARILEDGGNVGILVDQKFFNGVETSFFGAPCLTSPLLAKLARQYDCAIYPAHCVRLPNGRFRLKLEPALTVPLKVGTGKVDVPALMQLVNDKVEEWVREDPGQWMWFHKRWQIVRTKPVKRRSSW